jgi:ParB family transcriptional regulator, chromosome partitioning protein
MDNSKRNVHNSGPLGMMLKNGQIAKISTGNADRSDEKQPKEGQAPEKSYFKILDTGIEFSEDELKYINPNECEPWQYANRQQEEVDKQQELKESIRKQGQLQPAVIIKHPAPHDGVKYAIIIGRRRHNACLQLKKSFLVILKKIESVQDRILMQHDENAKRSNVSYYSDAILYGRLLKDGVFADQKELANKLGMSKASLSELLVYNKIPEEIIKNIPDIYSISKTFALAIYSLLTESKSNYEKILILSPKLGKSIVSAPKLKSAINSLKANKSQASHKAARRYKSKKGVHLFTAKTDSRGKPCIVISPEISKNIKLEALYDLVQAFLEDNTTEFGHPNSGRA